VLLYRVLSTLALLVYSPYALVRALLGRRRLGDVRGRLGRSEYPDLDGGVWVHAVSVGEVGVARSLLGELERRSPGRRRGLSVTTAAGRRFAESLYARELPVFAFPFDLAGPVEKALDATRPGLILLTETEIWPLFLERAARRGVPVALVNGRVSPRSFARYRAVRRALAASLSRIAVFAMQTPVDAERMEALGAPRERIHVTGNVKYDQPEAPPYADAARLRSAAAGRPVFVAASTAEGEEDILLEAWRHLPSPPLLALAPRRPERFDAVAALVEKAGFPVLRRSSIPNPQSPITDHQSPISRPVYLLDSIGELASLYHEAELAFVGGSLVPLGGHNPIEAWAAGVPVLVGPHTENFRDVVADGELRGFARRVTGAAALSRELARAFSRPGPSPAGEAARRFVAESRGAAERTIELVLSLLEAPARRRAAP
jgi:3-deoxy-D-manno-octulosonic-acid transferase